MSTPQATPSGAGFGFSFMDLFTPKTAATISFGDQPNQGDVDSDEATRKKSGLEAYTRRNKQALPKDFSDQVIENEMDLEKDFVTLETVNKLTELYSLAMAFYESEGNHKYKYFANKLQDLLMKANVKEMMVRELAPSKKTKQDEQQIKRLRLENKISKINAEKEAFTVVKSQEYRDRELNKVLEKNIQSQKDRIKQRLAEKKARSVSRAQSVTYLSDDNSSLPDDNIQDLEKELEDKPRLNDIAEVDEARYNTPPRKRGKDGQMVFFEKGKAQKTFKFDFDEDKKKPTKGHTRRHSFHRENVVAVIAQKRTSRAQSFGNGKAPFPLEKLKPLTEDNNKAITENTDVEEHSAGFARKQTKNQTIVEDCNEDKNKSVNSIESAASKNQVEEIVVQDEKEPEHIQNVESAVFLDDDDEDHEHEHEEEHEEQVIETEQTPVVAEETQVFAAEEEVQVQVQVQEQENTQPEVEVQAEEEQVIETEETQPVVEETQVVPEEENIHEQVQEVQEVQEAQEVQVEEQENAQPEVEEEQVAETEEAQPVAEVVAEEENIQEQVQEIQVEEQENIQPEAEATVSEVQQEVTETAPEQIVEEAEVNNNQEEIIQEPEQAQTDVKEEGEVILNEEPKVETEEVIEEVKEQIEEQATEEKIENVEQVKEEKNIRRRTDSEVADEKKLALMRQIDAEQKELIDAFIQKQAQEREEVTKKIEEKFEHKIQNMKEEMDEDEIAGDMWQRALKKFNKDKETEINESLEKLGQEQAPEFDKYKKKLLQQKMFKLAELSDE